MQQVKMLIYSDGCNVAYNLGRTSEVGNIFLPRILFSVIFLRSFIVYLHGHPMWHLSLYVNFFCHLVPSEVRLKKL